MPNESLAVVTGASSGFGRDFSRQVGRRGYAVVLVARREDALRGLAGELAASGTEAFVVPADLGEESARERLYEEVARIGRPVEILVNNAGLGLYGPSSAIPWDKERAMLRLDVEAVVHLCKLFVPAMQTRKLGYVLNISSIGAFQPTPLYASYSAAKSFVLMYSQALNFELRGSGVSVTVASPGIAATEFLANSKQEATAYQRMVMMTSDAVVTSALRALFARRPEVVPGRLNALTAFSTRFIPRTAQAALAYRLMKSNDPQH